MAYAVVEFQHSIDEDSCKDGKKEVEVVASKWIHGDTENLCWWPSLQFYTNTMAAKMVKYKTDVEDEKEWTKYEVKTMYKHGTLLSIFNIHIIQYAYIQYLTYI